MSQIIEHQNYEELNQEYDNLKIKLKKQQRKIRNVNRKKYNLLRETAAKSSVVKDIRSKLNGRINKLNNELEKKTEKIEHLQEECAFWTESYTYTYQKFIVSLGLAASSFLGLYFTFRGIENCVCY